MTKFITSVACLVIVFGFSGLGVWIFDTAIDYPVLSGYFQYGTIGALPIIGAAMGWILNEVRYW
jgi:hypothetical protein